MADEIAQIKQRLDIVEVLREYIHLTQVGGNWKALCPFHHEQTASFVVSPDKQIWHCFGCNKGGDILSFVQEIEGVEFPEALRILAQRAGVPLQQYSPEQHDHKTKLFDILKQAQQFYQTALHNDSAAKIARDYVQQRGVTAAFQEAFGLGYSFDDWEKLYEHLTKLGYQAPDMIAAGLILQSTNRAGYHDRFRGRLIFPLYDVNGLVVGFTARVLDEATPGGKYINSPQTELYDKSRIVYGLHRAKTAIKRLNAAIVVEGNMDVVTAQQAGFPNVVAVSGTAFTPEQVTMLKRYSPNLLLAFDMDNAGIQATQRNIAVALQHDMNIKVIQLPAQFKDPDECIQHDPALFKQAIRDALPIMDFFFKAIQQPLDLTRVEHKKKFVQQLLPVLQLLVDSVEQAHYVQKLADLVQVDPGIIQQKLRQTKRAFSQTRYGASVQVAQATKPAAIAVTRHQLLSQHTLAIMLQWPELWSAAAGFLQPGYLTEDVLQLYKHAISHYNSTGQFIRSAYLAQYPEDQAQCDMLDLLYQATFVEISAEKAQQEWQTTVLALHKIAIQQQLHELEFQLKAAEQKHDMVTAEQLLYRLNELTTQLNYASQKGEI